MTNESLMQRINEFSVKFNQILLELLPVGLPEAIRYCIEGEGKRLRPFMLFECAKLLGKIDRNIHRLAAGIELIHTYSLVHDDMPCMDNDDFRRGKPSCHKAFGEWQALLTGDCLLNMAFEIMLDGDYGEDYFNAIKYIAEKSGYKGMAGGQWIDLSGVDLKDLINMIKNKTSALFMSACVAPAIYFNKKNQADCLEEFAGNFGVIFQILDDLKDNDKKESSSILSFYSRESAECLLETHRKKALYALGKIEEKSKTLLDLCYL